jgi:RNA polymerase sigma-70 factor (ECF subfamily)
LIINTLASSITNQELTISNQQLAISNRSMRPNDADIDQLVAGCVSRQPAFQKELVRRFAPGLLSVARRYARRTAEADDILQEGLVAIFQHIGTYRPEKGSLAGWMRRIVINAALAHYRKARFQWEQTTESPPDTVEVPDDVVAKLGFEEILNLVNQLPDGAREVFNLAVFDDYSHDEIADTLGIPAGTSRSLLSRARKLLQQQILKIQADELARV